MELTALSFIFFLSGFAVIGVLSTLKKKATPEDYLLAGRDVGPFFTALSAVATNNSGFMFIGMIGATYAAGISSVWIMAGWILGDYFAWLFIHKSLREESEKLETRSIPDFLGNVHGGYSKGIVILTAAVTLIFLGVYAAAQLNAGSKALTVMFGWPDTAGALIGASIVLLYSFSGGIRASIWTDVAQSIVMIFSMLIILGAIMANFGSPAEIYGQIYAIDPSLVDLFGKNHRFGFAAFFISWIFAGLGVAGQPHVMVRAMAIRHPEDISKARNIYFLWYVFFTAVTIAVGMGARIVIPDAAQFDPETALPRISMILLHPLLIGMILAGLFAATMSTADSQVLSCSAALTHDLFPHQGKSYFRTKLGTFFVTIFILIIALYGDKSVFNLVILSWSVLATTMGPMMILRALKQKIHAGQGIIMILAGLFAIFIWRFVLEFHNDIYDVLPGMAAGFAAYYLIGIFYRR